MPPLKFSMTPWMFTHDLLEEALLCAETGVKNVELLVGDSTFKDNEKLIADSFALFSKNNIKITSLHAPFWPYSISWPDEKIRREFTDCIIRNIECFSRYASEKIIVIHPGELVDSKDEIPGLIKSAAESLERIAAAAAKSGHYIAVENMRHGSDRPEENFRYRFCEDTDTILELLDTVGYERSGVCLDTGHANIAGDIIKRVKDCRGRIIHTHISDNFGVRDDHLAPGKAGIPWKEFWKALSDSGYNGIINLEITAQKGIPHAELVEVSKTNISSFIGISL